MAAGTVLIYHFPSLWSPASAPSAYLAVDLFFLMSGFVIEHAYGQRLATGLGVRRFLLLRLIRLYPLYLVGTGITALAIAGAMLAHQPGVQWTVPMLVGSILCSALLLPTPPVPHTDSLYPLNVPAWSLFYELLVNVFFAATYRWWTISRLRLVIAAAGIGLVIGCWRHTNLDLGSGYGRLAFLVGASRVCFSFFLGVLAHRSGWGERRPVSWAVPSLLLVAVSLLLFANVPHAFRWMYDLALVMVVFPVVLAAAVTLEPQRGRHVYAWLGLVSYAVYIIHEPLLRLAMRADRPVLHGWLEHSAPFGGVGALVTVFVLAALLDRLYGLPMGRRLSSLLQAAETGASHRRGLPPNVNQNSTG